MLLSGVLYVKSSTKFYLRLSLIRENYPHIPVDSVCRGEKIVKTFNFIVYILDHCVEGDSNITNILRSHSGHPGGYHKSSRWYNNYLIYSSQAVEKENVII